MKIVESEYGYSPNNFHILRDKDTLSVVLTYPPYTDGENVGQVRHIFVDQESVRASDGIRMHYDYQRDGWVIEQAAKFAWDIDDNVCDPEWAEVAFIQSWAREKTD
jgi:hypothetical protein